ncbi:hypothetical protein SLS57_001001 [Botryosphaeria dothidea]
MVHTPVFVLRSLLLGLSPAAVLALPQNTASQSDSQDTLLVTTTVSNTPYTITFGPSTVTQATEVVVTGASTTRSTDVPAGGEVWAILGALPAALAGLPKPVPPPEAPLTPEEPTAPEDPDDPDEPDECTSTTYPQCEVACTVDVAVVSAKATQTTECASEPSCTSTITTCSGSATAHTESKTVSAEYEEETSSLVVDVNDSDNYDYDSPDLGGDAQYPMVESQYNKLGILELSSPKCATEGATFKRDDIYKNIKTFCKDNAGKKPGTGTGLAQDFLLGTTKVNVNIAFDSECTPKDESTIPEGQSAADFTLGDLIEDNCVFYFRAILDGCDTSTSDKHGGTISSGCLKYSVSSSSGIECSEGGDSVSTDNAQKIIDKYCGDSSVSPGQGNNFAEPNLPQYGEGARLYISYAESTSCPRGRSSSYTKDQCIKNFQTVMDSCNKDGKTFGGNITEGCGVFALTPRNIAPPGDRKCTDGDGLTYKRDDIKEDLENFCSEVIKGKKLDPPARGSTPKYSQIYHRKGGDVANVISVEWNDNGSTCPRNHESEDLKENCSNPDGPYAGPFALADGETAIKEFCDRPEWYLEPGKKPDPNSFEQGIEPKGWLSSTYRFPSNMDWTTQVIIEATFADPQPEGCSEPKKFKLGDVKDDCVKFLRQDLNLCDLSSGMKNGGVNMQVASDNGCINWTVKGLNKDKP